MEIKKKIAAFAAAAIAAMSIVPAAVSGAAPAQYKLGDLNNDGEITAADIVILNNWLKGAGIPDDIEINWAAADINQDGKVNIFDTILVKRTITGDREIVEVGEEPTQPTSEVPTEATTEAPSYATEAPTDATEAPTDATEAPTDATEAPTDATEAPTDATEAPTDATEAPTDATEAPTDATEAVTTTVAVTTTEAVTTIAEETTTEAETTTVAETTEATVIYTVEVGGKIEAKIDPANTGDVESIQFKVNDEGVVGYNFGLEIDVTGAGTVYVNEIYDSAADENGVVTVAMPEEITDPSKITAIRIRLDYVNPEGTALAVSDIKITIDGEETDPYVAPEPIFSFGNGDNAGVVAEEKSNVQSVSFTIDPGNNGWYQYAVQVYNGSDLVGSDEFYGITGTVTLDTASDITSVKFIKYSGGSDEDLKLLSITYNTADESAE